MTRSLPKKFDMKGIFIEDAKYICSIKLGEHIGSLQNFKMDINDNTKMTRKGVHFKANVEEDKEEEAEDTFENLSNSITLLAKRFGRVKIRLEK